LSIKSYDALQYLFFNGFFKVAFLTGHRGFGVGIVSVDFFMTFNAAYVISTI
jgi:hypothetical protein